jgi:hypothetical protein
VENFGREPISLLTPLGVDGGSEFGDLIDDGEAPVADVVVSFSFMQEQIRSVLDTLAERESGVIALRFGLRDGRPRTLEEISAVYGVTRERIRQIESKTMSKLRHPARSQSLRDYRTYSRARVRRAALPPVAFPPTFGWPPAACPIETRAGSSSEPWRSVVLVARCRAFLGRRGGWPPGRPVRAPRGAGRRPAG